MATVENRMEVSQKTKNRTTLLLLQLLSRFSRVRLFATPWTAAYQAPQSMGFSRQEYWSEVPYQPAIPLLGIYLGKKKNQGH